MQDKTKEKAFFDHFTTDKEYDVFTPYGYTSIIGKYLKIIKSSPAPELRIVDLGCGTGNFTRKFQEAFTASFFGVDISQKSIELATRLSENLPSKIIYCTGDIEHCCFQDDSFHMVLFSGVLHHFEDYSLCLREGLRILKKGGCALSYDPNIKNPAMWLYRHPSSPFFSTKGKTDNERLLSADQLSNDLSNTGFVNVNTTCISGVTFKYIESSTGRAVLPVYNLFERILGITPLASRFGSFLIGYGEKP